MKRTNEKKGKEFPAFLPFFSLQTRQNLTFFSKRDSFEIEKIPFFELKCDQINSKNIIAFKHGLYRKLEC